MSLPVLGSGRPQALQVPLPGPAVRQLPVALLDLRLATRLAPCGQAALEARRIGITVALSLCDRARSDQERLVRAVAAHQLRPQGDSHLVRRLLERAVPLPPETAVTSLGASAAALAAVSDVESGSLEDYADLDTMAGGAAAGDA